MNIHEYQAKELFRSYNIPVSSGSVAYSADEIEKAVNEVEGPVWAVSYTHLTLPTNREV